jgi:hypothetical protein
MQHHLKRLNSWCWNDHDNVFPPIRIFFLVGTCFFYFLDIFFDSLAAWEHRSAWNDGNQQAQSYFIATLIFLIFPSIGINFLSLGMYTWSCFIIRKRRNSTNHPNNNDHQTNDISLQSISDSTRRTSVESTTSSSLTIENDAARELYNEEPDSGVEFYPLDHFRTSAYIVVFILHVCQLGFIFRVIRLLYLRKKDQYSFDRYRDISFLRLMEGFLESAPQLLIQMYILFVEDLSDANHIVITGGTVLISLCSLSLAVADYSSASKDIFYYDPSPDSNRRPRLSWVGYILVIAWNFMIILSRMTSITLFASEYGAYAVLFGVLHFLVMFYLQLKGSNLVIWRKEVTDYTKNKLSPSDCLCNFIIQVITAAFNVFFPFKVRYGKSFSFMITYYILITHETALLVLLWLVHIDYSKQLWYYVIAPIIVFLGLIIGILLQLIYYKFFQPKDRPTLPKIHNISHPLNHMFNYI